MTQKTEPKPKRQALTPKQRDVVYKKTKGHCHVCGVSLQGKRWQADHVVPHSRGGKSTVDNFLPACVRCNRMRWHYNARQLQRILRLGVYLNKEMKDRTRLGKQVRAFYLTRIRQNKERNNNA